MNVLLRASGLLLATAALGLAQVGCSGACDEAAEQYCAAACACSDECRVGTASEGEDHYRSYVSEDECLEQVSGVFCASDEDDAAFDECRGLVADAECVESSITPGETILLEPEACLF